MSKEERSLSCEEVVGNLGCKRDMKCMEEKEILQLSPKEKMKTDSTSQRKRSYEEASGWIYIDRERGVWEKKE